MAASLSAFLDSRGDPLDVALWALLRTSGEERSSSGSCDANAAERQQQVWLLRDILGNPFRPAKLAADVLSWNDGCVVKLVTAAYGDRQLPAGTLDPARLAVLADALEEAGCQDQEVLTHLR